VKKSSGVFELVGALGCVAVFAAFILLFGVLPGALCWPYTINF